MDATAMRPQLLQALQARASSGAFASTPAFPRPRSAPLQTGRRGSRLAARAAQRLEGAQQMTCHQEAEESVQPPGLRGFQTFSVTPVGRVVCTSRGCRPVSDAEAAQMINDPHMLASKAAMQRYESALLDPSDEAHCNYPLLFAHFVGASFQGEKLVERIYEEALRASPNDPAVLCSYADYLTYQANDAQRASKLYERAVEADTTATALATYAHFLFRNPCQDASEREEEMWDLSSVESFLAANATAGSPQ